MENKNEAIENKEEVVENKNEAKEENKNDVLENESKPENDSNIKNVFEEEIFDVIKNLEDISNSSSDYLSKISNDFTELNKTFSQEIKDYITNKALKYNDLFNLDIKSSENKPNINYSTTLKLITKKTIKLIKKIIDIYSQIFSSLKENIEIMFNYLNISKSLHNSKPIEDFLSDKFNDIINSWLFMKIDFEKFDFNEALNNCNLDSNLKNLITNICKNKNFSINLKYPKNTDKNIIEEKKKIDIKMLSENQSNLIRLNIENGGNIDKIIDDKFEFIKLKKFSMNRGLSKNNDLFKKMPNLEKLTIKSCPNINVSLLSSIPHKLKKLYLEKNNFNDKDFIYILNQIILPNKNLLQNLELLSFANNKITKVDLSQIPSRYVFQSLLELNFNKNKIYKFIYIKDNFRKLKFINCCNNNLNRSFLSDFNKIIGLESGNIFLLDSELSDKYYSQLRKKLTSNEKEPYRMSYLNITYLPKIKFIEYFNDFSLNEHIMIRLKKLDLSFNGLDCDTFFKFIEKNKGFLNLKTLKLNGNNLDDTFFEKYLEYDIINKLEHLYLNKNDIGNPDIIIQYKDDIPIDEKISGGNKDLVNKLRLIYKFIQKNIYLTKLTITKNPISQLYVIKNNQNLRDGRISEYIIKDEDGQIIINCFFSFILKIKEELLTKEDEKGRKNFNIIFDCGKRFNINFENYNFENNLIVIN